MTQEDYWDECIANAAEECDASLTKDQNLYIAQAVQGAHENYGMAFYSPPASDRVADIKREEGTKLARLQKEFDAYQEGAEKAIKRALRQFSDANVRIHPDGSVYRYDGRIEQIL